jgi:hypothetical protein
VKPSIKENWPITTPAPTPSASPDQVTRKAIFEPSPADIQDDNEDESETSSIADSEEWIGEDDRASDSIAPSIMSEPEFQRHRLLMQQPPRSTPPIHLI